MAKTVRKFFTGFVTAELLVEKVSGKTLTAGARVVPVDKDNDENAQLRIDAGEKINGKQKLVLQVNADPKSKSLQKWLRSNGRGTHGTLATAVFDTEAENKRAEGERVMDELESQARGKLG